MDSNTLGLVTVLNNIGAIQLSAGLFNDALVTFVRVLHMCETTAPESHSKRLAITENIKRITAMQQQQQQENVLNLFSYWGKFVGKFLLF